MTKNTKRATVLKLYRLRFMSRSIQMTFSKNNNKIINVPTCCTNGFKDELKTVVKMNIGRLNSNSENTLHKKYETLVRFSAL